MNQRGALPGAGRRSVWYAHVREREHAGGGRVLVDMSKKVPNGTLGTVDGRDTESGEKLAP